MRKTILFLLFLMISLPASAAETIKNFHSNIHVREDASVIVTEQITVNREGQQIRRGIYRDLPRTKGVQYSVISVKRDGKPEPYFTENAGRFYRINTGNDEYLPRNGLYTFEITYQASNVILGFKDYDEIYWNVTGNEWIFPIEHASAKVFLPQGANLKQSSSYIGRHGSQEAGTYNSETSLFSTPRQLYPGEGLTVAVGFNKGFVDITQPPAVPLDRYAQYAGLILGAYFLITWHLFGRDPVKDAVMPQFKGLPDLTPAQAGWIYSYGHNKENCLAAALLQGGVSGFLQMKEEAKNVEITKLRDPKNGEEKIFEKNLSFPLMLTDRYSSTMESFMKTFETFLKQKGGEEYFTSNTPWLILGGVLILALTAGLFFLADAAQLTFLAGIYSIFFISAGQRFVIGLATGKISSSSLFILIFTAIHFSLMSVGIISETPEATTIIIFYVISIVALIVYSYLIIRPTYKGMQVSVHLDGIKMFLKAVDPTLPKGVNYEKMEALLPYAFLFGLEKEWESKMKTLLAGEMYKPSWYNGHHFTMGSCKSLHSTVSKSCTRPSKSGSRGGGFSGGGFGGGGGGGR
ncbi:MAG: DUF2207 domain-containing protein [Alphaproteobacteria bacterium]|nr:DUF2207 domain-containing protein [Alphaproteobacteria bacterium]